MTVFCKNKNKTSVYKTADGRLAGRHWLTAK